MMRYPSDQLFEEVAYLGYYLHWSYDELMSMVHSERLRWVSQVAHINMRLNEASREGDIRS